MSGCPSLEGHDQEAPVWQAACVGSKAKNTLCGLRAPFNVARPLSYPQMSEGCAPSGSFITIQLSVTNIDPHLLRARHHTRHGDPQLYPPRSTQGAEETAWKALERSGTQLKDGLFCLRGRWGEESRRMRHGEEMMFMLGQLRVCAGAGAPSCPPLVCLERKRGQGCGGRLAVPLGLQGLQVPPSPTHTRGAQSKLWPGEIQPARVGAACVNLGPGPSSENGSQGNRSCSARLSPFTVRFQTKLSAWVR